jgi:dTDP-4-dehydrorhamnose reductase
MVVEATPGEGLLRRKTRSLTMRIVVIGKNGQVASALRVYNAKTRDMDIVSLARPQVDLAKSDTIQSVLVAEAPQAIINAAAWTAVDMAESHENEARAVNATGVGALARAAHHLDIPILHISTDYVFDGSKSSAYVEEDAPCPRSVYGATKLEGEKLVAAATPNHAILRVAWVYSATGNNFVRTMLRLGETRDEVGVVADQIGNPTSADAISDGILTVVRNLVNNPADASLRGLFHMTARGEASWADFAEHIFAGAVSRGRSAVSVKRLTTAEYPTPTARPANSRLDASKIARSHGVSLPDWQHSLDACLDQLLPV